MRLRLPSVPGSTAQAHLPRQQNCWHPERSRSTRSIPQRVLAGTDPREIVARHLSSRSLSKSGRPCWTCLRAWPRFGIAHLTRAMIDPRAGSSKFLPPTPAGPWLCHDTGTACTVRMTTQAYCPCVRCDRPVQSLCPIESTVYSECGKNKFSRQELCLAKSRSLWIQTRPTRVISTMSAFGLVRNV